MQAGNMAVLVAAVVEGRPLREVAALAGLSVSSVQRRLRDPEVIAEIQVERARLRQETLGRFGQLRMASLDRLAVLVDHEEPTIALRAISVVLTSSARLDLVVDLEQRLRVLEGWAEEPRTDDEHGDDEAGPDVVD